MILETEIPEALFKEMKSFIETSNETDQPSFIKSALTSFLYQHGCDDRSILDSYLNDVFHNSQS